MKPIKTVIYRELPHYAAKPVWDIYIDGHFVDRYDRLADAKRRAEIRSGEGRWVKKSRSMISPVRYELEKEI